MARENIDTDMLKAALVGYRQQAAEIAVKIADVQKRLGNGDPAASPAPKRVLSTAARRRIAAAQKKRWAAARAEKTAEPKAPAKKRRIGAAGRKRISEATKKRWAEYRAQKAAAGNA